MWVSTLSAIHVFGFIILFFVVEFVQLRDLKSCLPRFLIIRGHRLSGLVISQFPVSGLNECLRSCLHQVDCFGTNFYIKSGFLPFCVLIRGRVSQKYDPEISSFVDDASVFYGALRFCQLSAANICDRDWAFELWPNLSLLEIDFELVTTSIHVNLGECLEKCIGHSMCKSAIYTRNTTKCQLISAGPRSVHRFQDHFRRDITSDLFENNCRNELLWQRDCEFFPTTWTGLFDEKLYSISDNIKCKQHCVNGTHGTCRIYTFDSEHLLCYISHAANELHGQSWQWHNSHLKSWKLHDCAQFKLRCQEKVMLLTRSSMRPFSGSITTKNGRDLCEQKISNAFDFEISIPYKGCGTDEQTIPIPAYSNLMFIKEGSTNLVTIKDKLLKVICRLHHAPVGKQSLSYTLRIVNDRTIGMVPKSNDPKPKYQIKVLTRDFEPADVVQLGDTGYLLITMDKNASNFDNHDFEITDLTAQDKKTRKIIQILDHNGCPNSNEFASTIHKDPKGGLRLRIRFEGFPNEANVIYQGLVRTCSTVCTRNCDKTSKTSQYSQYIRRERSVNVQKYQLLEQYLYRIRSKTTVINGTESKLRMNWDISKKPVLSRISECLSKDSCLFTAILALVQGVILLSCLIICYAHVVYCARWWRNRRMNEDLVNIQYQINNNE